MGASRLSYSRHSVLGCGIWGVGAHGIISYFFPSCLAFLTRHGASVSVIAACVAEGPLAHCRGSCYLAGGWESQPPSSPPPAPSRGHGPLAAATRAPRGPGCRAHSRRKRRGSRREEEGRDRRKDRDAGDSPEGEAVELSSRPCKGYFLCGVSHPWGRPRLLINAPQHESRIPSSADSSAIVACV